MMNFTLSSSMLDASMGKTKLLTVKFEEDFLAEFHAAASIIGARTTSALVHQFAMQQVREAKKMVDKEEFERLTEEKLAELQARSQEKSKASKGQKVKTKSTSTSTKIRDEDPPDELNSKAA